MSMLLKILQRHMKFHKLSMFIVLAGGSFCVSASTDKYMAYLAYTNNYWQVWLMEPDTRQHRQLTTSSYDKARVSWYPDGNALLINGTQGQLAKISTQSGAEQELDYFDSTVVDAVVSPDGKLIAYSLSTGLSRDQNNIWTYNLLTKKRRKLTHSPKLQHHPVWSHDGTKIYFLAGENILVHDIWAMSVDGKTINQVTFDNVYNFDVAVNSRGHLLFSSNRKGNYEIYRFISPKNIIRETTHTGLDAKPSWDTQGEKFYFESTRTDGVPNIWQKNMTTGELVQITNTQHGARAPVLYRAAAK